MQPAPSAEPAAPNRPKVGLFATCLVDLFRPNVGFAAVELLEAAGCDVDAPEGQTCCGQPAWNSGDRKGAAEVARRMIEVFEPYDYVVLPSGSCGATVKKDYVEILRDDSDWLPRAQALSDKTFELITFLTEIRGVEGVNAQFDGVVTYHDSCSGLRSLGVKDQPRQLLSSVDGLRLREMEDAEVCCGFGGTFCVKYPDISNRMVSNKTDNIAATSADLVLAGDLGCLMNMAGKLSRQGRPVKARHVAEILAGMTDEPAIGEPQRGSEKRK
ncbi:MAG: (Fe-S)-binding protein [Neomegalonema sp.]|nr:(Fe-S)-binding protein [Neomegalonema sp.]